MTTRDHLRLVGFLHLGLNLLGVFTAIAVLVFWLGVAGVAGAAAGGQHGAEHGAVAGGVVASLGGLFACGLLLPSLPGFVGGWALLRGCGWARPLLLVVSVVHVLTLVPFSVLIGGYSLWALWPDEAVATLERMGDRSDFLPRD